MVGDRFDLAGLDDFRTRFEHVTSGKVVTLASPGSAPSAAC